MKPPPTGVVTGPFQRDLVAQDRIEERGRERGAIALQRQDAGRVATPTLRRGPRLENLDDGTRNLRADAVAGNERDRMCHGVSGGGREGPRSILDSESARTAPALSHRACSRASQKSSSNAPAMLTIISRVES